MADTDIVKRERATIAETERRVSIVYNMLLNGANRRDILQFNAKNWMLSDRAVDNIISKANKEISEVCEEERETQFGLAIKRLNALYFKSLTEGDIRTALNVQKEINEVVGLHETHRSTNNVVIQMVGTVNEYD